MPPVVPKPRWTPEICFIPNALTVPVRPGRSIGPKSARDQVSGEIVLLDKRR
jgi:hypothetical protein